MKQGLVYDVEVDGTWRCVRVLRAAHGVAVCIDLDDGTLRLIYE